MDDYITVELSKNDVEVLIAVLNDQLKGFHSLPPDKLDQIEGASLLMGKMEVIRAYLRSCM